MSRLLAVSRLQYAWNLVARIKHTYKKCDYYFTRTIIPCVDWTLSEFIRSIIATNNEILFNFPNLGTSCQTITNRNLVDSNP